MSVAIERLAGVGPRERIHHIVVGRGQHERQGIELAAPMLAYGGVELTLRLRVETQELHQQSVAVQEAGIGSGYRSGSFQVEEKTSRLAVDAQGDPMRDALSDRELVDLTVVVGIDLLEFDVHRCHLHSTFTSVTAARYGRM
ncbi:MAG: hypothetical protein AAGF11_34095 [Myxococcota bacterium]